MRKFTTYTDGIVYIIAAYVTDFGPARGDRTWVYILGSKRDQVDYVLDIPVDEFAKWMEENIL